MLVIAGYATTAPGLGGVLREELKAAGARLPAARLAVPGLVPFQVTGLSALVRLLGRLPTAHRLGPALGTGRLVAGDLEASTSELVRGLDLAGWLDASVPLAVRCTRLGEHSFSSMDVERLVGGALYDRLTREHGREPTVDLEDPGAVVRVHVDPQGRAGCWLDLVGYQPLHRRGWRRYAHPAGMKPTLAAGLLHLMEWDGRGALVDPLCGSGTLGIEAAWRLHGVAPVRLRRDELPVWDVPVFRDADRDELLPLDPLPDQAGAPDQVLVHMADVHEPHLDGARENAQAAGVAQHLRLEARDVGAMAAWAPGCQAVAANPPYGMRSSSPREVRRVLDALLQGASDLLDEEGTVGLMTPQLELVQDLAPRHGFSVARAPEVQHGNLAIRLIVLGRE